MSRPSSLQPTDNELAILKLLWRSGPLPLSALCSGLRSERPAAKSTVATILTLMRNKNLVRRIRGESGPVWEACSTEAKTREHLVRRLLDRIFDGSAQRLVAHLLKSRAVSEKERREIRRLLDESDGGQ